LCCCNQGPAKYGGVYTVRSLSLLFLIATCAHSRPIVSFPPQVTLIPGDGIGPELADSVKEIFKHLNVPVEWDQYNVTGETGGDENVFKSAMESLKRNKVGLKGQFPLSLLPASFLLAFSRLQDRGLYSQRAEGVGLAFLGAQ
jgi:hypothetical protein